jgi:hypothetical protein
MVRGSLLIRHGKGDKRREAGMDQFGFEQLAAWLAHRVLLAPGPLFCVIDGQTRGRRWSATAARAELRELAVGAPLRPPSGRPPLHAHRAASHTAVQPQPKSTTGSPTEPPYHPHIQHTDLGTTSTYLQGIDPSEIIDAVRSRRQPTITATAGLTL